MKKNAITFNLFLTAVIFILLPGCQKSLTGNRANSLLGTASKSSTLTPLTTTDVYVAGSDNDTAVYWKNGVETKLAGPAGTMATGIVAIGGNVYVCGYGPSPTTGNLVAEYWYNGALTNLSDGSQFVMASGIAVSGSNVYVCGYAPFGTQSWCWKNGVATLLPSDGEPDGIAVDANGNVYISNDVASSISPAGPSYYKNDTLVRLTGDANSYTRAVATAGTNFYVAGVDEKGTSESALLWANGTSSALSQSYTYQQAMAVAAVTIGGSTYVSVSGIVGNDPNDMHIAYWNNLGDDVQLGAGEIIAGGTGVAMDASNNTYVCGTQMTINPGAWLWTIPNGGSPGTPTQLGSNAIALAVTVGQ